MLNLGMATRDVRKESPEVIYELRVRAVEMKLQGLTHGTVATTLDVSVAASRRWWRMYCEEGKSGLVLGQRGRPIGVCRTLSPSQEKIVKKAITDKIPEQLKMPFALWTRPVISQFIAKRFGIKLPVRTLGHYLKRWDFTPQRPKKVAYEQQPAVVREWLDNSYPQIAKQAKAQKAEILWGDETGVSNQDHAGRGYAPRGQTPVVRGLAKRVTTSMISAIGNRGDARFMIFKGGLKSDTFIKFLGRLIKGAKRKIFLIVDNLRVHKAKVVAAWVAERCARIELFFLPPYSPELNPDEYLNNTMKSRMRNQPKASCQSELKSQLTKVMKSAQRKPALIQSLFRHPKVAYAA
jgi:transposase